MPERFASVWTKITWAHYRIEELASTIRGFGDAPPFEIEIVGDPVRGVGAYRVKNSPPLSTENIPLMAGDAAHSIRAALDHLAYAAVSDPTPDIAFPVWRRQTPPSSADWAGLVSRKLKGASPALKQAITALQPYRTGSEDFVWVADHLDIVDKHRLLIAVAGVTTSVSIDFGESLRNSLPASDTRWVPSLPLKLRPAQWEPLKPGVELFRCDAPDGLRTEPSFEFGIVLGEPEQLEGQPIVEALTHLANQVETLLRGLAEKA